MHVKTNNCDRNTKLNYVFEYSNKYKMYSCTHHASTCVRYSNTSDIHENDSIMNDDMITTIKAKHVTHPTVLRPQTLPAPIESKNPTKLLKH